MQFGIYAPIPMATMASPEVIQALEEATSPLPDGRRDAQFDHAVDLLLTADEVGFDITLYAERHLGEDLSAWVLASAVGSRCNRMRAMVAVHPGLWDPVMIAKHAVSLDRICKGRMAINIVNGWFDEEFEMFGGTILSGEDRYRRATEFIEIMRGLWTNETFTYKGKFHSVENARLLLKPATPTPPEMFSVSSGDMGRDFIANTCDWWFVNYPKEAQSTDEVLRELEASIKDMHRRTERSGRKIHFALNPVIGVGDNEQAAIDEIVHHLTSYTPEAESRKVVRRMLPNTLAGLIGPPAKVRRQVQRYADMGLDLLLCKMIPTPATVRQIAAEIIHPYRAGSEAPAMVS